MEWARASFDWNLLRAFLATAEAGSYSAAAKALEVAQPTVGRQVAQLEAQLGVALFTRAGRGVAVTPTGLALLEHARTISTAAMTVARVAEGRSVRLAGRVTVTASELDAVVWLAPAVAEVRAAYPGIELDVVASTQTLDLTRREADIALRSVRPTDGSLVARRLRDAEARLYGTPAWVRRLGEQPTAAAVKRARVIGFDRADTFRQGLAALGLKLEPEQFPVVSASQFVQWALVKAGVGVGIMTAEFGDVEPGVGRVWPGLPPIVIPRWLVTHREVHTSRRVRAVVDVLARHLGAPTPPSERQLVWVGRAGPRGRVERR